MPTRWLTDLLRNDEFRITPLRDPRDKNSTRSGFPLPVSVENMLMFKNRYISSGGIASTGDIEGCL